jgi:hypothetical protein
LIKWKGYPESNNTWENADQVHAPTLIKLYHRTDAQKAIKARQIQLEWHHLSNLDSHPHHSSGTPSHPLSHSPIILRDSTTALVWSPPSIDEDDNRLACSLHASPAQSPLALRVHTTLPASCATLMVSNSTLRTSTASNDNSLYALHPLAPNSSTQCLPSHHSTPQMNCLVRLHSSYPHTTAIHQLRLPSHLAPSKQPSKHNPTSRPHYSETSPMGYYKPSPTERPPPLLQQSGTRIESITLNNASYITKTPSTPLPRATPSTTGRSQTSTSRSAMGFIKRPNGFDSTKMALSQATTQCKDPTNNRISSTYMHRQTSASTPFSKRYQTGSGTCSQDREATFRSYSRLWLTRTIGAWPERSRDTTSSTTTLQPSPSRSNNTNVTSTLPKHGLDLVSHVSCSPVPLNRLPCCKTYLGRLE